MRTSPTVEFDNAIWFRTLSRMSEFLWHSSKWTRRFIRFRQYTPGLEVACSLKNDLKVGLSPSKKNCFICFYESPLKMMKNAFYFTLKALFVLKIQKFLSWVFCHAEKTIWLKTKVNFKTYDITTWWINNYNIHIAQYLMK